MRTEINSLILNIDQTILNGQTQIDLLVEQEELYRKNLLDEIKNNIDLEYVKIWE